MAILASQILDKAPADDRNYTIDFVNVLASGDSMASVSSLTQTVNANRSGGTPASLTLGSPTIVGTTVAFEVSGGTANVDYLLTATVLTTLGATLVGPGILRVASTTS